MKKDNRDLFVGLLEKVKSLAEVVKNAKVLTQILTRKIPVILEQPESVEAPVNTSAYFIVTAENVAQYQWQYKRKETGVNWTNASLTGNNTPKLQFSVITSREVFWYRCEMTGIDGSIIYSDSVDMKVIGG